MRPTRLTLKIVKIVLSISMSLALSPALHAQAPQETSIAIDAHATGTAFPHFWERMFGSGRAILTLRQSYRDDLRTVKQATGFEYVRFHAIFHDETGFYALDAAGKPVYNFSYIDQIYDGLLGEGVRPFVELSFTPKALASDRAALHAFWYKQNVSPPKDYALWDEMIRQFTQHLVDRYGLDEVTQWYFEVWNEPNIDFWAGNPKQATYFELYDRTARAVKAVNPRLRVGGPATAQAAWVKDFLAHTKQNDVPVDFVSSHIYANDTAQDVFKTSESIPRDRMVARSVEKIHEEIAASPYPRMPLIMSEYNATYANEPDVTDTIYMGPWLANNIRQCDGLTEMMSYWALSDVFEEQGVVKTPFYGGYGLVAEDNIGKPALNAFAMLHRLGTTRLSTDSDSALVTRREDGALVIALWNYAPPMGTGAEYTPSAPTGPSRTFDLALSHVPPTARVTLRRLDEDHGNVVKAYDAMHRPAFPSRQQIEELRKAARPSAPETMHLQNGKLHVAVPSQGLVVLEVK